MRPLARVALAVALTPAALLALAFCDRLWVTAIRPELLNLRARRAGMRIDGAVARSDTVGLGIPEREQWLWDRPDMLASVRRGLVQSAEMRARSAHEQDMADMAGTEEP